MYRPVKGRTIRAGIRLETAGRRRMPARRFAVILAAAFVCVAAAGVTLALLLTGPDTEDGAPSVPANNTVDMNAETIYEGVYVDDIPLGGLTRAEAKAKIEAYQAQFAKTAGVTVAKDAAKVRYTVSELPHAFDADAVADEAWAQGRTGTEEERRAAAAALQTAPVRLKLKMTIDTAPLEEKIRELTEPYEVAAVDAKFVSYDAAKPEGERLTFTSDIQGSRVDADALWAAVKKEFDDRTFGTVDMAVVPMEAKVRLADLQSAMKLIGKCDTYLSNHTKERYTNIKLAGQAVNGIVLAPGETFSFNDTAGERTEAKGYKMAPIDNQGVEDVGIGGGICQVSGTLFNACMRAGLEMVERHHHSVPSTYLKMGKDATVDFGKYDLRIKNTYDKPVVFILHFGTGEGKEKYTLYAEIYGPPFPAGVKEYDLEAKTTRTFQPREGFRTVRSRNADPGSQVVINAHKGYEVQVFLKTTLTDGTVKLSEQPLYTDTYDPDCKVIVYYYEDTKPTGLPTPSPSPTPKLTPPPTPPPTPSPSAQGTAQS